MPERSSALVLKLLGGFELTRASGIAVTVPRRKSQALLAYLALGTGQRHPRDKLAALLWPEVSDRLARQSLRQSLLTLRQVFPPGVAGLLIEDEAVGLEPGALEVDVDAFECAVREGGPAGLHEAARLYRGDFLEGLPVSEPSFEEWLTTERARLRDLALEALGRLLADQTREEQDEAAAVTAQRLLALDPLQEAVHRALMRIQARRGRQDAALRQYQVCVDVLQRELGAEPAAETREIYRDILRQRTRRATPATLLRTPAAPPAVEMWSPLAEAPLVDREAEIAALRRALEAAEAGRGHAVLVLGEAGIGKSRLLAELARAARARGHALAAGRAYVSTQILPFGAWLPVLQTDGLFDDRAALAALAPGVRGDLARLLPAFEEAGQPRPAGPADATRLFEAVAQLLDASSRRQPLVIVLEDLQWADEMSLRLVAFVTRRLAGAPLLLVGSAREEEMGDAPLLRGVVEELTGERRLALLHVGPLSEASTGALVRTLAPAAPSVASGHRLEAQIWAVSGGNPFVTVETVRALAEGANPQSSGAPRLPERVRQLVAGRRERLTDLGGRLADVAAVIGRDFEFALLRAASALGEAQAAEAAEELVRRRVLRVTGERFEFVHDRLREVIYDRLLPPRRVLLHRQAADALEALTVEGNESRLGELGAHYHAGEVWTKAVAYLRRAGARALDQAASASATEHFERALEALGHLPRNAEYLAAAIDLRLDLRNSLHAGGNIRGGQEHLAEAERLAASLGDPRRGGLAAAQLAGSLVQFGETEAARDAAERALALAASLGESRIAGLARTYLGYVHYAVGAYGAAERCFEDNVTALGSDRYVERFETAFIPYVVSLVMRAWSLAERGAFPEALESLQTAERAGEDADHPYSRVYVSRGRGLVALRRGDVEGALLAFERARGLDRSTGLTLIRPMLLGGLGQAYALAGRVDEALPLLQEAAKEGETMGTVIWQSLRVSWLGEACLLSGQIEAAAHAGADALDLAQTYHQRGWKAYALKLLGDVAARSGQAGPARAHYDQAMALARELDMQPLVGHCHAGLGALQNRAGDRRQAEPHLAAAVEIYRALGMTHWLGPAHAALRGEPPA